MLLGVRFDVPHPATGQVTFCPNMQNISQVSKLFESENRSRITKKICLTKDVFDKRTRLLGVQHLEIKNYKNIL